MTPQHIPSSWHFVSSKSHSQKFKEIIEKAGTRLDTVSKDVLYLHEQTYMYIHVYMLWNAGNKPTSHTL